LEFFLCWKKTFCAREWAGTGDPNCGPGDGGPEPENAPDEDSEERLSTLERQVVSGSPFQGPAVAGGEEAAEWSLPIPASEELVLVLTDFRALELLVVTLRL